MNPSPQNIRALVISGTLASLVLGLICAQTVYAQTYNDGVYGGGVYNQGARLPSPTPRPTSTTTPPTPTASPSALPPNTPTPSPPPQTAASIQSEPSPNPTTTAMASIAATPPQANSTASSPSDQRSSENTLKGTIPRMATDLLRQVTGLSPQQIEEAKVLATSTIQQPVVTVPVQAAAVSAAVAPLVAPLAQSWPFLQWRYLPGILGLLLRRPRQPWGVVYDAQTKEPLDPVVLTLTDAAGKQTQVISDIYGRYEFLVEPGEYRIRADKTNYQFPSLALRNQTHDEVYEDLYFGEPIRIRAASRVALNIPMDALVPDWNQVEKKQRGLLQHRRFWGLMSTLLFWCGLLYSLLAYWLNPGLLAGGLLVLYALLMVLRASLGRHNRSGVIRQPSGQPLAGAVVRLINVASPVTRPPVVTKKSGQYAFLVDQGTYQVVVEQRVAGQYREVERSSPLTIRAKYGAIHQDLVINNARDGQ